MLLRNAGGQWGDSFAYMTLNGLILGLYANTVRPDKGRTPLYNCTLTPAPPPPPPVAAAPAERGGRRLHAADSVAAPATGGAADAVAAAGTGGAAASRRLYGMGEIGEVQVGRQLSPWFLSTDAMCEASGLLATCVGYIATWKVLADFTIVPALDAANQDLLLFGAVQRLTGADACASPHRAGTSCGR